MDLFVMAFYAVICGLLSWLAPNLGCAGIRMGIGAIVGVIAATILPVIRSSIGY